jgi:hypothetical protein
VEDPTMKRRYGLVFGLVLLAGPAFADSKIYDDLPPGETIASICDTVALKEDGRLTYSPPIAIPDNAPAGVLLGPLAVPNDNTTFINVVLALNMAHTWIGDIVARLDYYEDCAQAAPSASVNVICRPGSVQCGPGTGVGCSNNFVVANQYRFNNGATGSLPTSGCADATNVAAGCYKPTGVGAGDMSAFQGLHKGGCFKLFMQDNAGLDVGSVTSWIVYSLNQNPVPAVPASWGVVKNIYR